MAYKYVKPGAIKKRLKELGRRCKPDFLDAMDRCIESKLAAAAAVHNGGRKTVDSDIAIHVGFRSFGSHGERKAGA